MCGASHRPIRSATGLTVTGRTDGKLANALDVCPAPHLPQPSVSPRPARRRCYHPAMESPDADRSAAWQRLARRVARRVNLAWWLDATALPLVILGLAGACAILILRRESPGTPLLALGGWALGAVAAIAATGWLRARRRFESTASALVRIEATMQLRNRLSAAQAGVTSWPDPPPRIDDGLRWRWSRVAAAPLAALACLAAGLLLPVSARPEPAPPPAPLAWQQIEDQLGLLDERQLADPQGLEETRRRLDELRRQPPEDWFSHSSLEATDNLRRAHAAELDRLQRELGQAERALGSLQQTDPAPAKAERNRLAEQFDQALQGLQQGALKPNPELLKQLAQLDPKALDQLDPKQFEQLRDALRQHADALKECQGGGDQGDQGLDKLLAEAEQAEREGRVDQEGEGAGRGGVNRGPGTDPNVLGRKSDHLDTGDLTGLETKDLSRSLPGDLLELQDGAHEIDKSPLAPTAGGAIGSTGRGGDQVWREALDPAEQQAVKRFFE